MSGGMAGRVDDREDAPALHSAGEGAAQLTIESNHLFGLRIAKKSLPWPSRSGISSTRPCPRGIEGLSECRDSSSGSTRRTRIRQQSW